MANGSDFEASESIAKPTFDPLPILFETLYGHLIDQSENPLPRHRSSRSAIDKFSFSFPHLQVALTHRSAVLENPELIDNERLEFLGDSILSSRVSDVLFHRFPDSDEGYLTLLRSSLVNTDALARIALDLRLDLYVRLGQGERSSGGATKRTILSDAFEAVIACVHLDLSFEAASDLIDATVLSNLETHQVTQDLLDAKSALQIWLAKAQKEAPIYRISKAGPDHLPVFVCQVHIGDGLFFEGSGGSKKEAQQAAATNALEHLDRVAQ